MLQLHWEKFVQGEDASIEKLYRELGNSLFFVSLKYTKNKEVSRDLVSDFFLYLLSTPVVERKRKWSTVENIQAYFNFIIRNKSIDYLRKNSGKHFEIETLHDIFIHSPLSEIVEELKELVNNFQNQTDKQLFQAHLDGYDNHELAEKFALSEKTVRNKLSLMRKTITLLWNKNNLIVWIYLFF